MAPLPPDKRTGFADVGLVRLSIGEILLAYAQSLKAKVVALVSGTPEKMRTVASQYGVEEAACYGYEDFEAIADNPDIKAV